MMLGQRINRISLAPIVWFLLLAASLSSAAQYKVEHLPKPYNTPQSETGAVRVGDTVLAYSTMQPISGKNRSQRSGGHADQFSFAMERMTVYQARIARSGKIARPRPCRWGINSKRDHTGNLALDPLTHDIYFTRCPGDDPDLRCEIWWAKKERRGWGKPHRLQGTVNSKTYTATQPSIGRLNDGSVVLYFVSDRPGGEGGLDIWQAQIHDGVSDEPTNLGPQVNSKDDDITPFYDQPCGVLYFSSNRPGGVGGFDIYSAPGSRNTWQKAEPVCRCLNSEQNDLYFSIFEHDSLSGQPSAGYLSSNRTGSLFRTDSLCCNDIYSWHLEVDSLLVPSPPLDTLPLVQTAPERRHFGFPLFLYFHNDDPDPRSRTDTTATSYSDCWQHYVSLQSTYLAHQSTSADSMLIKEFFDSCVIGNYHRTEELFDYIEEQLDEGYNITLRLSGYASPVFTDTYNTALSRRRIASFVIFLKNWRSGLLADAIEDHRLILKYIPNGIDPRSMNHAAAIARNPVYGINAALSRRIEISSIEISQ